MPYVKPVFLLFVVFAPRQFDSGANLCVFTMACRKSYPFLNCSEKTKTHPIPHVAHRYELPAHFAFNHDNLGSSNLRGEVITNAAKHGFSKSR